MFLERDFGFYFSTEFDFSLCFHFMSKKNKCNTEIKKQCNTGIIGRKDISHDPRRTLEILFNSQFQRKRPNISREKSAENDNEIYGKRGVDVPS